MRSPADVYEQLSQLSARMVEAARAGDRDTLTELRRGVFGLGNVARTDCQNNHSGLDRKLMLIQRILADDAEVRRLTEPWVDELWNSLGLHAGAQQENSGRFPLENE